MRIHSVCTTNGCLNEGMNNIEAHLTQYFEKDNIVIRSPLRDIPALLKHSMGDDAVMLFTRGLKKTYYLARIACAFNKNVYFVIVQKPSGEFEKLVNKHPLRCHYLYVDEEDVRNLRLASGYGYHKLNIGIKSDKFTPATPKEALSLKINYGFSGEKPLVVHIGHLSVGRGLEDFLSIDGSKYDRLIVDSGIFEAKELKDKLIADGVKIVSGYIESVENIYRMADVYFFPTRDGNYVISVPLSVMEALSCGTPVVAYRSFKKTSRIETNSPSAIAYINDSAELNVSLECALSRKINHSYLKSPTTWEQCADDVMNYMKGVAHE